MALVVNLHARRIVIVVNPRRFIGVRRGRSASCHKKNAQKKNGFS